MRRTGPSTHPHHLRRNPLWDQYQSELITPAAMNIGIDFKTLCERALRAIPWFLVPNHQTIANRTRSLSQHDAEPKTVNQHFPTATSHAVLALAECGVRYEQNYKPEEITYKLEEVTRFGLHTKQWSEIPHLLSFLHGFTKPPGTQRETAQSHQSDLDDPDTSAKIISRYLSQLDGYAAEPHRLQGTPGDWIDSLTRASTHFTEKEQHFRETILYAHLLAAIESVVDLGYELDHATTTRLLAGIAWAERRVKILLDEFDIDDKNTPHWGLRPRDQYISPYLLLNSAISLQSSLRLFQKLKQNVAVQATRSDSEIHDLIVTLERIFEVIVDKIMARRKIAADPYFDAVSLTFALRGWSLSNNAVRGDAYYAECIRTIVESQLPSGLWPDGMLAGERHSAYQTPSVEIALCLAQCVYRDALLFQISHHDVRLIELVLPALHAHAAYLYGSRVAIPMSELRAPAYGWSSDRIRSPDIVETWITSLVSRVSCLGYLMERASRRAAILQRYGDDLIPESEIIEDRPGGDAESAWEEVTEPDQILLPVETIKNRFIRPIAEQAKRGRGIIKPGPHGISMILYGPPGSGKNYLVNSIAECLQWPLISLNPGDFIRKGIERIEETASSIFRDLLSIDHCVVFFDECDELFRDRDKQSGDSRNILTFATASMLPKLHDLHDRRNVIFIVATNFLGNIDKAVRRVGRFDDMILIDRPDAKARHAIITRTQQDASDSRATATLVQATNGLTYLDIRALCRDSHSMPDDYDAKGRIKDYVEWCFKKGARELSEAGVPDELATQVHKRWEALPGYPQDE